jgi:hypothetical protein
MPSLILGECELNILSDELTRIPGRVSFAFGVLLSTESLDHLGRRG